MKRIIRISFFQKPIIWILDKYHAGLNRPGMYVLAIIPSIIVAINLLANLTTLFEEFTSLTLAKTTLWLMFIYGIINLFLIWAIQRIDVRLHRERNAFKNLNEKVISVVKKYRSLKNEKHWKNEKLEEEFIETYIKQAMQGTVDTYLNSLHRGDISIVVKYFEDEKLIPIRAGEGADTRSMEPEHIDQSYTYRCLSGFGKPLRFIYVQDVKNFNKEELKAVGPYASQIQSRAGDNYSTFIAVPIRGAKLPGQSKDIDEQGERKVEIERDLGLLGIDLERKYGFGNITKSEIFFLTSLADMLSELIVDLLLVKKGKELKQAVV